MNNINNPAYYKWNKRNHNYGFNKKHHVAIERYALMGKPLDEMPKTVKVGIYNLATIPRENLGIDSQYQRALKHKQISKIQENWDDEICDLPSFYLYEDEKTGKVYPQIIDGQNRTCANPHDEITGRVINTLAPVERCLQANNPKTKSVWDVHAQYWCQYVAVTRLRQTDNKFVKGLVKAFQALGYDPKDVTKFKSEVTDISGQIGKYHQTMYNAIARELGRVPRVGLAEADKASFRAKVMTDVVTIIDQVFKREIAEHAEGTVTNQWGQQIWAGLTQFLTDSREDFGLGGSYDVDEIIKIMRRGQWRMGGTKGKYQIVETINDYDNIADKYKAKDIKGVSKRNADCWQRIIFDMHKYYQRNN
jgi:hypothetical protein|tara:strand:- start:726 stop:1814 length:1089 start_codon:yes stop_codon:yes gene_type:complete